jgi:midasin
MQALAIYLLPAVAKLNKIGSKDLEVDEQSGLLSESFILVSLACLFLYVPDKAYDPALRSFIERDNYIRDRTKVVHRLSAIKRHNLEHTEQSQSFQAHLLDVELQKMGKQPSVPSTARPSISRIPELHIEFRGLLDLIKNSELTSSKKVIPPTGDKLASIRKNINAISDRLSSSYREYDDLVVPVVNTLQCLDIGLSINDMSKKPKQDFGHYEASDRIPFISSHERLDFDQSKITGNSGSYLWHNLRKARLSRSIDPVGFGQEPSQNGGSQSDEAMAVFHNLYVHWKEQLSQDQEDALKKSSLYRYRGGEDALEEIDDKEINELFPDFESPTEEPSHSSHIDPAKLATLSATAHAHLFGDSVSKYSIQQFMKDSTGTLAVLDTRNETFSSQSTTNLLSPMILSLGQVEQHLAEFEQPHKVANFYTAPSLTEASKLTSLIKIIKHKFSKLQDSWPEHTTIQDVLSTCNQATSHKHTEPLAKLILGVEKLHNYVYQWQLVASKEFSAAQEYDLLTALIIDWRRYELSTWAKLFDTEQERCEQEAQSWWFIAYEVVIAAPMSMRDAPEELAAYAEKLLANLNCFFKTTSSGQFQQRLQLLKQLEAQLYLISKSSKALKVVLSAVANFTQYYGRFTDRVSTVLAEGRHKLEKDVKEVILLASWKDTNIVALRDSAKRSHQKLFRIVRKFRDLLGKPVESILAEGIPKLSDQVVQWTAQENSSIQSVLDPSLDSALIEILETQAVPQWQKRSPRLIDTVSTSKTMALLTRLPKDDIDVFEYFESFTINLNSSIIELGNITPAVSTEKNKELIKHLKTRKRKLFADILKSVRGWGIRHNLGQNVLAEQSSVTAVLASLPVIQHGQPFTGLEDVDEYLHRFLDIMSRNRIAARNASEELSANETARSMGFLEGFCYELRKQRTLLAIAIEDAAEISKKVEQVANIWAKKHRVRNLSNGLILTMNYIQSMIYWLPPVLQAGVEIIEIHGKLTQLNHSKIISTLNIKRNYYETLLSKWKALPMLPKGISTSLHEQYGGCLVDDIQEFRQLLVRWGQDYPLLSFVFDQITTWINVLSSRLASGESQLAKTLDLSAEDSKITQACDSILVTVQELQEALSKMPTSEDPSWIVTRRKVIETSLQSLRAREILEKLDECFQVFNQEPDILSNTSFRMYASLLASALPILRQYEKIHRENVARLIEQYRTLSKTAFFLSDVSNKLLHNGFCSPSEKSDPQEGKTEKLEDGTGLGDGEGAEDISKDIADDEDLSELAQEPNKKQDDEEIEDEKDAVEMQDEMEGEMGDISDKGEDEEKNSGDEESGDEMDEEVGDVGDLDPTAVDERLWDEKANETEKEQEGQKSKGEKSKDEQTAAQDDRVDDENVSDDQESESEDMGVEENEEVGREMPEKADPYAEEGENLDLPDDMDMDGDGKPEASMGSDDEEINGMSDVEDGEGKDDHVEEEEDGRAETDGGGSNEDAAHQDLDSRDEVSEGEHEEEGSVPDKDEAMDQPEEKDSGNLLRDQADDANADEDNIAPSEAQGVGLDQDQAQDDDQPDSSKAEREHGSKGDNSTGNDKSTEDGQLGSQPNTDAGAGQDDNLQDTREMQAFKKLGDSIDRWHRQQKEIQSASEDQKKETNQDSAAAETHTEFEHLMNDENKSDAQALGTGTEEQAHALDESMALDTDSKQQAKDFQPDDVDTQNQETKDMEMEGSQPALDQHMDQDQNRETQTFIGASNDTKMELDTQDHGASVEESLEDIDDHLSTIQLGQQQESLRSLDVASQLWKHYESQTRHLSFTLTEQLRLILAPTLATKMRGDFRTGKRLNIKRIIPYIASQYKRDKIWMRRSVPSKRAYQIMLAVDDSKSMGESGSGELAFETLALVSKSLSILEVGQICVVGFGEQVKVAHEFDKPFSSEAGVQVFRQFSFDQQRTDVRKLVEESLSLFRDARARSVSSSSQTDLWQLQLIISDGVCEEHETLRRLVRQAQEERVMIIFVIVDNKAGSKGGSIMQMSRASFEKDDLDGQMKLKMRRYMDDFPFNYYLVVRDVKQLPAVLSQALRGWFSEVVEGS